MPTKKDASSVTIVPSETGWRAKRGNKVVGYINVNESVPSVTEIESHGKRGERIGTRLYEEAAKHFCAQRQRGMWGYDSDKPRLLQSDTSRSAEAEGLWAKQFKKKRAEFCWRSDEDDGCSSTSNRAPDEATETWYRLKPAACKKVSFAGLRRKGGK